MNHDVHKVINQILTNGFEYGGHYKNFKRGALHKDKNLSKPQLKTLKNYKEYYEIKPSSKGGTIKPKSVLNALQGLRYLGLFIKKPYEDASTEDLIRFVKHLHDEGKSDATITNWKVTIRSFYKWMHGITKKHEFPVVVDHELLKPQRPKPSKRRTPDNFLTNDELLKMLEVAGNNRNRALIMLTYGEGSLRAGEIASLNWGSVRFSDEGCTLFIPESKSNERDIPVVDCFPYLRDYMNNEYALSREQDSPLFYSLAGKHYRNRIHMSSVSETLKRVAKRAGIKKRVFCHMGRHQSITKWARDGLVLPLNARRAGITTQTLQQVYLHYDNTDVAKAIRKIRGTVTDEQKAIESEEKQKLVPKKCVRCHKINPATALTCHCGAYLDLKSAEEAEQRRRELDKSVMQDLFKENFESFAEKMITSGMLDELLKK